MNKINIQEITELIASQTGQTKKFSEQFLRELVDVIGEYLQKDGIVKVKGLGTFKVIRVEERKSVDVATGNEIILPSHNKVQFIPEDGVKEQVNAPYSHLSTTFVGEPKPESTPVEESTPAPAPVAEPAPEPVKPSESAEPKEEPEQKPVQEPEPEEEKGKHGWWIALLVLVTIVVALFFTRPYWLPYVEQWVGIKPAPVEEVAVEPVTEDTVEAMVDSTLLMYQDSVSNAEAEAFATEDTVAAPERFDIHTYNYRMAAEAPVREVVTVIDGSRLTMVAYRAYGSKDFWVYVYDANRDVLRRPSDVNKGMELKIADLPQELTDPDSPEAIEFARELGKKY